MKGRALVIGSVLTEGSKGPCPPALGPAQGWVCLWPRTAIHSWPCPPTQVQVISDTVPPLRLKEAEKAGGPQLSPGSPSQASGDSAPSWEDL